MVLLLLFAIQKITEQEKVEEKNLFEFYKYKHKSWFISQLDISEVNIVPKYGGFFELQIIYKKKNCKRKDKKGRGEKGKAKKGIDAQSLNHSYVLNNSNINKEDGKKNFVFRKVRRMALDPGVSNFFSVIIEGVKKGFLIDGKIWKSLTTFRLKTISKLKSRVDNILNKAKNEKESKRKGSPVELVEAVAVAKGSKVRLVFEPERINLSWTHRFSGWAVIIISLLYLIIKRKIILLIFNQISNRRKNFPYKKFQFHFWESVSFLKLIRPLFLSCSFNQIQYYICIDLTFSFVHK